MINVVQVVEDLKLGGLERVIENITMHLDPQRFHASVLCLSRGGEIAERLAANGKDVEILGIENYHSLFSIMKVARWLKSKDINIIHTHGYPAGVLGRTAAVIAGIKHIFHHVHTTYLDMRVRNYLMEKILGIFTDKVICCSDAVKRHTENTIGISKNKLTILYNGIPEPDLKDASILTGIRQSLHILEDFKIIGCVASLVPHKGHKYLLEAFRKIDNVYLLLAGDGILRNELERFTDELGIKNRVIFVGYNMDITPYFQIMDIFVLPSSEREGLSISVIEAMAAGKPVIATDVGGNREAVVDGVTGILVEPKDKDALAKAINKLLESPQLMQEMGKNGRERYLKNFTLNQMMKELEKVYSVCK
ncbi:MAG: glycosyltransferase [Nitrospinota bacterium]